ncbi:DUF2892 domain-containing protein [Irregularibacter muris]|uniref:DUF2892 domain-containing protein n=1 Tax=Irregularibacter muris TaxID=1796619 RepID=A0AAE3HCI9_9FIRM|nr:DUF2892 domain-containing protein [Irregularibacter muris]MCR1897595.1 DUF2892 domain-containing protein [Irregularibacter muris]
MQKNVGTLDAYMRISCGLMMFGYGIIKKSLPATALGSWKVAEGVTRFCPMMYALGMDSHNIRLDLFKKKNHDTALSYEE